MLQLLGCQIEISRTWAYLDPVFTYTMPCAVRAGDTAAQLRIGANNKPLYLRVHAVQRPPDHQRGGQFEERADDWPGSVCFRRLLLSQMERCGHLHQHGWGHLVCNQGSPSGEFAIKHLTCHSCLSIIRSSKGELKKY